jgi:predicted dehydrogenase
MSASLEEADVMIEACEKNGAKLVIGHNGRFSAANTEIRRLVADGAVGQPTIVYHIAKRNAGLLNTGTHAIDGWRYILSDPETLWVIGQTARTTDRWERRTICEDLCMGLVCFEGGTRGIYEGDLPEPRVTMPRVTGTEGKIKTGEGGSVLLQKDNASGWQEIKPPSVETDQFQELIDWMEGKIPEHRSTGRQARYTMEIMMAIYESLRIKNVVVMPLKTKESPLDLMVKDGTLPVLKEGRYDIRAPFPEQKG